MSHFAREAQPVGEEEAVGRGSREELVVSLAQDGIRLVRQLQEALERAVSCSRQEMEKAALAGVLSTWQAVAGGRCLGEEVVMGRAGRADSQRLN